MFASESKVENEKKFNDFVQAKQNYDIGAVSISIFLKCIISNNSSIDDSKSYEITIGSIIRTFCFSKYLIDFI